MIQFKKWLPPHLRLLLLPPPLLHVVDDVPTELTSHMSRHRVQTPG